MRYLLLPLLTLFSISIHAQYKSFRISSRGDTLDCIDLNGLKQGKWLVKVAPLRGEPGYEEEGVFINDLKEGTWRRFNLMGDPVALENYRWGKKNGLSRYYSLNGLEREENWRAFSPGKTFDTIDVRDLKDPNKYDRVVIKNDGRSLRHGTWTYYNSRTGYPERTEKYILDILQEPSTDSLPVNTAKVTDSVKAKLPEKTKPKEVLEFEKKTSGKKNKVRDGRTGN